MTTYIPYGLGTVLETNEKGEYIGGRAMTSDGVIRKIRWIAKKADYTTTIKATMTYSRKGVQRVVQGYITLETAKGYRTEGEGDPFIVKFATVKGMTHAEFFPGIWRAPVALYNPDSLKKQKRVVRTPYGQFVQTPDD